MLTRVLWPEPWRVEESYNECMKKIVREESGKIVEGVVNPVNLLGDLKPMSEGDYQQKLAEDERKKQEEIAKLNSEIKEHGRDVEGEMDEVRRQKQREEEKKEKEFLEKLKVQRERERAEESVFADETTNPHKKKKKRGGAFMKGKGKASTSDMSATGEFKGQVD